MSWGLYQIMGDNLVGMGLDISPIEYCSNQDMQFKFFWRYCSNENIAFTLDEVLQDRTKREKFAKLYNGPGNYVNYAQRMLDVYQHSVKL